jgi:hypothetical protein
VHSFYFDLVHRYVDDLDRQRWNGVLPCPGGDLLLRNPGNNLVRAGQRVCRFNGACVKGVDRRDASLCTMQINGKRLR